MTRAPYGDHMASTTRPELAEAIVADGFEHHWAAVSALLSEARRRGVSPVLVALAGDPGEPVVARQRALGQILEALDGPARTDAPPASITVDAA